ncbi:MAG TPA: glutamine-hydrolyzing GMP synthase, partial [Burkholderiales bacterium]|nr:glutamine-hydrolyzing GMP synthase [Burkholderiales bacterium]
MTDPHSQKILILDFGAQYVQLIARRVREAGVYCEIYPYDITDDELRKFAPRGIILSGGPASVTEAETPRAPQLVFELGVPVLGICYGQKTMAAQLGGEVQGSDRREFGYAKVRMRGHSKLFKGIRDEAADNGQEFLHVWMSHGDRVTKLPPGFKVIADTDHAPLAGIADEARHFYGV